MGLVAYILLMLLWGLIVGAFARLALPGPDPLTWFQTSMVGVGGSFLAGVVSAALFNRYAGSSSASSSRSGSCTSSAARAAAG